MIPLPKKPKIVSEKDNLGVFEIEGLYPGYGLTLGNALRRVLISSLEGAAVTSVKIKGADHEFSALDGVKEDVIQIILNLKKIRVKLIGSEAQELSLSVKGEKKVKAKDISKNSNAEILNPEVEIATLTSKKSDLEMTLIVEKGLGYMPSEMRKKEKLAIGAIRLDAIFSPVERVNFEVEDMRVGDRTDYNRLRLYIQTDGSILPSQALKKSVNILVAHFEVAGDLGLEEEIEDEGEKNSDESESEGEGEGEDNSKEKKSKPKAKKEEKYDFLIYKDEKKGKDKKRKK